MAKIVLVWENEDGVVETVSGEGPTPDVSQYYDRRDYSFGSSMRGFHDLYPPRTTVRIRFTYWGVHQ